jgi:hypothetical protein
MKDMNSTKCTQIDPQTTISLRTPFLSTREKAMQCNMKTFTSTFIFLSLEYISPVVVVVVVADARERRTLLSLNL